MTKPVTIENGLVCSTITADTIKHMTLKWNNQEIPHDIEAKGAPAGRGLPCRG